MISLIDLIIVILAIIVLVKNSSLKQRIQTLENAQAKNLERLAGLERWRAETGRSAAIEDEGQAATAAAEQPAATEDAANRPAETQVSAPPTSPAKLAPEPYTPPRAFVFTRALARHFGQWLIANWTVALAALSLALGGIFMVQYGVENGLLTPLWRVIGALVLGGLLIGAGEVIRRRRGDESDDVTRFLPSAITGAGLATLFAAVLSARLLYELVSSQTTLAGLVLVSVLAVVLGWLYGPVLTAVGIIGATAAPFLVGSSSGNGWMLFYYFPLIAIAGLAVDSVRRWAWVSAVVLIATSAAASLLYFGIGEPLHYQAFLLLAWLAAVIIPVQSFMPSHQGQTVLATLAGAKPRADFPSRIVAAMTVFVCAAAFYLSVQASGTVEANAALILICLLLAATLLWMHKAEALKDMPLFPALAFIGVITWQGLEYGPLIAMLDAGIAGSPAGPPIAGDDPARFLTITLVLATIATLMAFWRMMRMADDDRYIIAYALGAAAFAPAVVFVLQFLWAPAASLGKIGWSAHVLVVAAVMAILAERTLRRASQSLRQLCAALFTIAALSLLSLALFVVLTQTALTLALAVVVILTIWLDRRFDLPVVGIFTKIALAVIAYRLVANPGFFRAVRDTTSWLEILTAYGGTLALLYIGWTLTVKRGRRSVQLAIETSVWTIGAVFACAVVQRLVPDEPGLLSAVWAIAMLAQINRLQASGRLMGAIRIGLAVIFGLFSAALIAVPLTFDNPLTAFNPVSGPLIFDSLAISYLPLAAALGFGTWKLRHMKPLLRVAFGVCASLLAGFYTACEIRRFWRGNDLSVAGVTQAELYSYTVAMILVCAVLLLVSFARRSNILRKVAMTGIGLTIAKVFLVDISGLEGLFRVVTFLGLGLALVTLAWLERIMNQHWTRNNGPPAQ